MKLKCCALVLMMTLLLVGCTPPAAKESVQYPSLQVVKSTDGLASLPHIFDDEMGMAYIDLDSPFVYNRPAISEIMTKKRTWMERYPDKRIISISTVTAGGSNQTNIVGAIITYEFPIRP